MAWTTSSDTTCWVTEDPMIPLGHQRNPWAEETSCQENSIPHLTQNFKALGSWVTSLIKLSPHPYLTNVGLQLHTCFFPTISTSSVSFFHIIMLPRSGRYLLFAPPLFRSTGLAAHPHRPEKFGTTSSYTDS